MRHNTNILLLLLGQSFLYLFLRENENYTLFSIGLFFVFFTWLSLGVLFLKTQYFLSSKNQWSLTEVLLSFDDGPHPEYTEKILAILKKNKVKAIFFIVGKKAEKNPELIQRILSEGHQLGNHTWSHTPFFALQSASKVAKEIKNTNTFIEQKSKQKKIYFRPPIGYSNPIIARELAKQKTPVLGWSLRSYDTLFKNANKLKKRLTTKTKAGDIVLMHDNLKVSVEILDDYIQTAKQNGLIFVSNFETNIR